MKRIGTAMLATAVGVAAVVFATGQPALADTSVNLPLSSWAYLDSQSPKTKFVNPSVPPPVGTLVDSADKPHTYRSYFTYDLTQLKGSVVHNSYLYTNEDTVTDCSTAATIEVWRTAPVKSGTSWNNPPAELEKLATASRGRVPGTAPTTWASAWCRRSTPHSAGTRSRSRWNTGSPRPRKRTRTPAARSSSRR
ncbi:hypothetical protein GCM10027614_41680 [Micromonospora vulcania]